MKNNYDICTCHKHQNRLAANCWSCTYMVLLSSSFGVPLVLLWLSYKAMTWIRNAFEEGLKVMRKYSLFTNAGSLAHEACLLASLTHVQETMNIGYETITANYSEYNIKNKGNKNKQIKVV